MKPPDLLMEHDLLCSVPSLVPLCRVPRSPLSNSSHPTTSPASSMPTWRRHFDEEVRERVRSYQATEAYEKAKRKRAVWTRPLFGEAKDWHGLRRFRLRGREKVNIE